LGVYPECALHIQADGSSFWQIIYVQSLNSPYEVLIPDLAGLLCDNIRIF
jgi:hypothetical protein